MYIYPNTIKSDFQLFDKKGQEDIFNEGHGGETDPESPAAVVAVLTQGD